MRAFGGSSVIWQGFNFHKEEERINVELKQTEGVAQELRGDEMNGREPDIDRKRNVQGVVWFMGLT